MRLGTSIPTLKVGSTAIAAIKRGAARIYDPDVAAFQQASNAADVTGILDLVDYLKAQSLWNYARFYPMKSAQNAGSGSTVYGLGGLTSNNMTLVNSPTWGSGGVTFDGSTQYGNVGDIFNGGDLTVFARVAFAVAPPAGEECVTGAFNGASNTRSFFFSLGGDQAGDPYRIVRCVDGTSAGNEVFHSTGVSPTTDEKCFVAQWLASNSRSLWINSQAVSLAFVAGGYRVSTYNSPDDVFFAAINSGGAYSHAAISSPVVLYIAGASSAPTTTQRETITDLINAL